MATWREAMHALASHILARVADQLDLKEGEEAPGAAQLASGRAHDLHDAPPSAQEADSGPGRRAGSYFDREFCFWRKGQFHVKRCRPLDPSDPSAPKAPAEKSSAVGGAGRVAAEPKESACVVRMPPHTDPSLISLVAHDRDDSSLGECPAGDGPGALGLQIYHTKRKRYEPLPRGGWGTVTVIAGDVLALVVKGVRAPLHRVVARTRAEMVEPRVAATFFIQPDPGALLRPVVSPRKPGPGRRLPRPITYGQWKDQKYAKYFKKNKKAEG